MGVSRAVPCPSFAEQPEQFAGFTHAAASPNGSAGHYRPTEARLLRVLVVDDDRDTADSLAALIKLWGHDVRSAYEGGAVAETMAIYEPHVLLMDVAMPRMSGCRVVLELRKQARFENTLLVAITGYADEAHRLAGERAGFDHYLAKPVDLAMLEQLLLGERRRRYESPTVPSAAPRPHGILVVDDEAGLRRLLDLGMRQQGFAVWLAADGNDALEQYRRHRASIDVVLLDVRMPGGLDGPGTLAALREIKSDVRCCFMSGDPGGYTESGLLALGATVFIRKPFRPLEVARKLWELVSTSNSPASSFGGGTARHHPLSELVHDPVRTVDSDRVFAAFDPSGSSVAGEQGDTRALHCRDQEAGRQDRGGFR